MCVVLTIFICLCMIVCFLMWNCVCMWVMYVCLFEIVWCAFSYLNLYIVYFLIWICILCFLIWNFICKCEWLWKCLFGYVCFYVDLKLYNMCLFIRNCRLYVCLWFWQCLFLFVCLILIWNCTIYVFLF